MWCKTQLGCFHSGAFPATWGCFGEVSKYLNNSILCLWALFCLAQAGWWPWPALCSCGWQTTDQAQQNSKRTHHACFSRYPHLMHDYLRHDRYAVIWASTPEWRGSSSPPAFPTNTSPSLKRLNVLSGRWLWQVGDLEPLDSKTQFLWLPLFLLFTLFSCCVKF